jgi:2'-5' RNA ligase
VRLFVAIRLSEAIRRRIAAATPSHVRGIRWVAPENLHLTLKFLGEVEEARAASVAEALRSIHAAPFDLSMRGFGSFPGVVWVGCEGPAAALAEAVERVCAGLDFPRESRPFNPHVTIGRVKERRALRSLKLDPSADFGTQRVESFALMRSDLTPRGPIYTALAEFALTDD